MHYQRAGVCACGGGASQSVNRYYNPREKGGAHIRRMLMMSLLSLSWHTANSSPLCRAARFSAMISSGRCRIVRTMRFMRYTRLLGIASRTMLRSRDGSLPPRTQTGVAISLREDRALSAAL